MKSLCVLLLSACLMTLVACGGGSSSSPSPGQSPQLSGNWQFSVAKPQDDSFHGGLQGGFLLGDKSGSVKGSAIFAVVVPPYTDGKAPCDGGSATITGSMDGQNVKLTAKAGTRTFTFTGMLSSDNTTMSGSYDSTPGTAADGSPCGTAQTGMQWSAVLVPPMTGGFQGTFHSTGGTSHLEGQNFLVTGSLVQGGNVGASSATVTGTMSFVDPQTLLSNYPCLDEASVTGEISGNVVTLQVFATNGSNVGQIGGFSSPSGQPVLFDSTQKGSVLHNVVGSGYGLVTSACQGSGNLNSPGDVGNLCLGFGSSTACTQPVLLSPPLLTFPAQMLGSVPTKQTVRLTNNDPSGTTLEGLQLNWSTNPLLSDFDQLPNLTETDDCATGLGQTFTLIPGQSCTITIAFSPHQSCPWLPSGAFGNPPALCPVSPTETLQLTSPKSVDDSNVFTLPITYTGLDAIVPSVHELDFGSEAVGQASLPQTLTFTNQSNSRLQILHAAAASCGISNPITVTRPLQDVPGLNVVGGLQIAAQTPQAPADIRIQNGSVIYYCDGDSVSGKPNFQIDADTCTGALLAPQASCSVQISFVPQPGTNVASSNGLDYFLQLNTVQCSPDDGITSNCEIDSARFPVELRANGPSPLRMSPGAGLDFGKQAVGQSSAPLTVTLFNDPTDPQAGAISFSGNATKGDYKETDDCPFSLAPGASCTLTVTFKPKVIGLDPGTLTINYNSGQTQTVYLRGSGQ